MPGRGESAWRHWRIPLLMRGEGAFGRKLKNPHTHSPILLIVFSLPF
jgi:hypothetical protein